MEGLSKNHVPARAPEGAGANRSGVHMMKTSYVAASLFSIGLAFSPAVSSAAVIQTAEALMSVCPALSSGTGCPEGGTGRDA